MMQGGRVVALCGGVGGAKLALGLETALGSGADSERLAIAVNTGDDFEYLDRLRYLCPSMPRRQLEVCALIVRGYFSQAIALKLGISLNTVLTFRRRAYARLRISSQNELTRLVLS